ncbi:dephospho-CoA kinase [Floccifex sp.]|uniref:dephospho-CoA kinase n=1 Tax=Floccifex sp. TaxID=2815810 RepID=UPI003F1156AD
MHTLSKKKVIAITGSMGSGKSQASSYISNFYPVLDCDKVNARLLEKGQKGYEKIAQVDWIVFDEKKNIDKKKMAFSMFQDIHKKQEIEAILHPLIFEKIKQWTQKQNQPLLFVEVPLLFEIHAQNQFDEIWCIYCDENIAMQRLIQYRHFTFEEAKMRLNQQLSVSYKKENSDVCIENNGNLKDLYRCIDVALERSLYE